MVAMQTGRTRTQWAVVGGGNGGQAAAAHLALLGFPVRLYDIFPATVEAIQAQGGIQVQGVLQGFGSLEVSSADLDAVIPGADVVMVVAPATAHADIAKRCASLLRDGQLVFLHPGSTGGALEFRHVLQQAGCSAGILLAESSSLLYACRSPQPGRVELFAIKKELMVAALPAGSIDQVLDILQTAFPQLYAGRNVLETSLTNPNAMLHPAPTLLNTSMIESGRDWHYYWDGITPSIGAFVEALDAERLAVGQAYGIALTPIVQWYHEAYQAEGDSLVEAVQNNEAYAGIKGQGTLQTRYLLEDIPMGLVPMQALGRLAGYEPERMQTIITLAEQLLQRDLSRCGRTLENLGLKGFSRDRLLHFLEQGIWED
jgi:opine dehydrogenase